MLEQMDCLNVMRFLWSCCLILKPLSNLDSGVPQRQKSVKSTIFDCATCPLRKPCSDLGSASAKPGPKHGFPNSKLHPKSKATFPFLSFLGRSSIPTVILYAGYSASQLAVFYFISRQWYCTKTLPLLVSSSDLQLAKLIQTAFMWHWGFPVIWFPCLCSAGHPRFYELIPAVHFSAVTHEQSASLFTPRTPFYIWKPPQL